MIVFAKHALSGGTYHSSKIADTLRLPLEPELLEMITTFPFNVILAVTGVLIIGTIIAFTRKPTQSKKANVDMNSRPSQRVNEETPNPVQESNIVGGPAHEVEEEMPQRFKDNKDGVVKLYNWFYRFAQKRLNGVTENMTPREFESVVLSMIPSNGVSALEYLVTSFEIANYSDFKITKEIVDKSLRAIEVLKALIESGSSYVHDHDLTNVEQSPNIKAHTA